MHILLLRQNKRLALLLGLASLGSLRCANPGREIPLTQSETPPVVDSSSNAEANKVTARIIVDLKFADRLRNVKGYLVGVTNSPSLQAAADTKGRFLLGPIKPGSYDLIIEGQKFTDDPGQQPTGVAIRLSGIDVQTAKDSFVKDIDLLAYVSIKGQIKLLDGSAAIGAEVLLDGTPIKTTSTEDGSYELARVPQGQNSLTVKHLAYAPGLFEQRLLNASQVLPQMTLLPEDQVLEVGMHYLGEALPASGEATVTLFLRRPAGMNLYRIGFTEDLKGTEWNSFQSAVQQPLAANQRTIYLQFSQNQQQLSALYTVSIPAP